MPVIGYRTGDHARLAGRSPVRMSSPDTLEEALRTRAADSRLLPVAGGTDVMVGINSGELRPDGLLDLSRLDELATWRTECGELFVGAGMSFARILRELPHMEALAAAARSVGSPQIRNRATLGGNLGTASPAGDALPVLAAHDAQVDLARSGGRKRSLLWKEFLVAPGATAITSDELILGARWRLLRGPQCFIKIGTRRAMTVSVASLCLALDELHRTVRVALGSSAPTVIRAPEAESLVCEALSASGVWDDPSVKLHPDVVEDFGEHVAAAASPIDDVRGSATYRLHALRVLARRALTWALNERADDPMIA